MLLSAVSDLLGSVWQIFVNTQVPGFSFSFGDLLIANILVGIALAILNHAFGIGGGGTGYRSKSARNPKISSKRKGDEL